MSLASTTLASGASGLMDYKLHEQSGSWTIKTKEYLKISNLGEGEVVSD